jgi:hypothetical protein
VWNGEEDICAGRTRDTFGFAFLIAALWAALALAAALAAAEAVMSDLALIDLTGTRS